MPLFFSWAGGRTRRQIIGKETFFLFLFPIITKKKKKQYLLKEL